MDKLEFTKKMQACPLFSGLELKEMYELLTFAKFKEITANDIIINENAVSDVFFIVESGLLETFVSAVNQKAGILVKILREGDLCGEMALLGIEKRTASVRAKKDSRLIIWNAVDVLDYFRKDKNSGFIVMKNLASILASRVRDMNLLLRNYADAVGPSAAKYL